MQCKPVEVYGNKLCINKSVKSLPGSSKIIDRWMTVDL